MAFKRNQNDTNLSNNYVVLLDSNTCTQDENNRMTDTRYVISRARKLLNLQLFFYCLDLLLSRFLICFMQLRIKI